MLQFRQLYTRVGLAGRIQELPYALGTVASRTDESGHHDCTLKVQWVVNFFLLIFSSCSLWFQHFFLSWWSVIESASTVHKSVLHLFVGLMVGTVCRLLLLLGWLSWGVWRYRSPFWEEFRGRGRTQWW